MEFSINELLEQLGGNAFVNMTGAKNFVFSRKFCWLQFDLPKGSARNKADKVRITLLPTDEYCLTFFRYTRLDLKVISEVSGVPVCNLRSVFTENTGLRVSF